MATLPSQLIPIEITPGVQPNTDRTPLSTPHYVFSDKIRFWRGVPQKIGGWIKYIFERNALIGGIARTLYSAVIGNIAMSVIGTNSYLYSLIGQTLINITPLQSMTHSIANAIETDFATLANNPIATTLGSPSFIVADTNASHYQLGDVYTLSGATTTNGIPNTQINAAHIIRAIGVNLITITVAASATSNGSGGGASVVRKTGLLTITAAAHGMENGLRVGILAATSTGGISAVDINKEFIIRNVAVNTFQVMTSGVANSHVTAGGGGSTTYQEQIDPGNANASFGFGYGLGKYGVGLYGVAKTSSAGRYYPRIWFIDRFGDRLVMTPGNQGSIYIWDDNTDFAPVLLENAPTDVNYLFVSNNILVTFGHQNVANQIFTSDQNDATIWTASSTNQVFQDVIEGADRLLSSVPVLGTNLIFTGSQTYTFSYIGLPLIWSIQLIDNSVGIIASMARCSVNNVAYWMAQNNFYRWSGGNVEQIPSATQDSCTALNYVFGNINSAQVSKSFAWYNDIFNEIWFHYPSSDSNECNRIVRLSLADQVWSIDTMDRTCAEYPDNLFYNPRLISSGSELFVHETGANDNDQPLRFQLQSNLRPAGKTTGIISGFVPDSLQIGTIQVELSSYQWPQAISTPTYQTTFDIDSDGERENVQIGGRFWQYTWSGEELDQTWVMGAWSELPQGSSPN